jgi:hypothetical protein
MLRTTFDAEIYSLDLKSSLYNCARIFLLYGLVCVFIGVHRQELSVPKFGGQALKRSFLHSRAKPNFTWEGY